MKLLKSLIYSLFFVSFVNATEPAATPLIDLNTADEATLETLNGVGAKKAKDIIKYRTDKGGFKTVEEFRAACDWVDVLLIDATERPHSRPSDDAKQKDLYSGKKKTRGEKYGYVYCG